MSAGMFGCRTYPVDPAPEYLPQTTEDNVLHNFQVAWRRREINEYTKLLASDFRFNLDPATRKQLSTEYWDRETESARTGCLLNSADIQKITIELDWPVRSAVSAGLAVPRETWSKLSLNDVFLDVDFKPPDSELTTYRVEDQTQRFFFRRGRTYPPSGPADTLVYIVEWRDEGAVAFKSGVALVEPNTWSRTKARVVACE